LIFRVYRLNHGTIDEIRGGFQMFKRKRRILIAGIIATLSLILAVGVAYAMGLLNLPDYPVSAQQDWLAGGTGGTVDVTLSGVGTGFDVSNSTYPGWCIEDNGAANFPPGTLVTLFDSTGDSSSWPVSYQTVPWDQVNYLLNHQSGTPEEVQAALWLLAWGSSDTFPVTPAAQAMYDAAVANGTGFDPVSGQTVAVMLYGDGIDLTGFQDAIMEVVVPNDGEGCTPGYWRNLKQHGDEWVGYSPNQYFDDVFGIGPHMMLADAVRLGGGGENALIRHAVAGLLNASSPDVDYFYTEAEIIAMVQNAYAQGDYEAAKDLFEAQNSDDTFCPID
jgi:hypothetical protein